MDPITLRQNPTSVYGRGPYNSYLESSLGNPEDTSQRKYNVTMKNHSDCEQFYDDMETLGGTSNIPDRECHCCRRRSISRNTVYKLTYAEAEKLLADERVAAVELHLKNKD